MFDARVKKLAEVLVNYSVSVQRGDKVFIRGSHLAEPLLKALLVEVLKSGGHPYTTTLVSGGSELFYRHASDEQLTHIADPVRLIYNTYDVIIDVMSTENTKALSTVAPEKLALANRAATDLFQAFMARSASGALRWVGTLFPTPAYAQDAEMGLTEYEDFVFAACLPDLADPVGAWRAVSAEQQRFVDWLAGKRKVRVEAPDVELEMEISGRSFVNCDGKKNMPDGEIFTGPVEESVEGHVRFSYPTVYQGRKVEGVSLRFEKGRVVKATAEKGEDFLQTTLGIDEGARYVGEFAIGTNKGITKATGNTLFDEKINGSFHMALGAGMPETGSKNQSAIHWDMVCSLTDGGRIWVDGEKLYENGRFVIAP
jgi:aminopeptidase